MSLITRTALAVALLAAAPLASAATDTATMNVSITIENSCTVAAEDLSFGLNSSLDTALTSSADVTVDCTSQGPIAVAFSAGGSGDATAREMTGPGAATIDYQLYRDAGHTEVLGDGTSGTEVFGGTGSVSSGGEQTFTVHGLVPVQGAKPIGAYSDAITATLTY